MLSRRAGGGALLEPQLWATGDNDNDMTAKSRAIYGTVVFMPNGYTPRKYALEKVGASLGDVLLYNMKRPRGPVIYAGN